MLTLAMKNGCRDIEHHLPGGDGAGVDWRWSHTTTGGCGKHFLPYRNPKGTQLHKHGKDLVSYCFVEG